MKSNTGYYTVGEQVYLRKVEAIYNASRLNVNTVWHFHENVFESIDWTIEPNESLNDLYKQRAQQLRDQYDYLVVFFSGGADSTNMVYSFLKNGIHIDEIVAGAPVSGLNNWTDTTSTSAENTISETRLAQLPALKKIAEEYPTVKVTIHDYFQDMLEYKTDEWLWNSGSYIHPTFAARYRLERDEYNHLKQLADSGKSIGLLYGLDKPFIIQHENNYVLMFRDTLVNNGFQALEHPMVTVELFYYTADVPQLMVKQAHVTARYISQPENYNIYDNMLFNSKNKTDNTNGWRFDADPEYHTGIYERAIVPAIYPMLENQVFQAAKPRSVFFAQHDAWFNKLHRNTRTWDLMVSDFKNFFKGIRSGYYITDNKTGIPTSFNEIRRYYTIGPVSKFKPIIV